MKPSEVLATHRDAIRKVVSDAGMANPRVFGSVLHGDDAEGSDLDLLVDAPPRASLLALAKVQVAIEDVVGVPVDLLTPDSLPVKFREQVVLEPSPYESFRVARRRLLPEIEAAIAIWRSLDQTVRDQPV